MNVVSDAAGYDWILSNHGIQICRPFQSLELLPFQREHYTCETFTVFLGSPFPVKFQQQGRKGLSVLQMCVSGHTNLFSWTNYAY